MLRRIVRLFVVLPAVVVLAAIGVANSQWVRLSLDPFRPDDPALSLELPLYAWLLGALILGVVLGGDGDVDDPGALAPSPGFRRQSAGGRRTTGSGPAPET